MNTSTVLTGTRLLAVLLIGGGFAGALANDQLPLALDSPWSVAFYLGIGCAIVSIYLGLYLANTDR